MEFNQGAEWIFGRMFADSPTEERMMGERDRVVGLRKDGTEFPAEASIVKRTVAGKRGYSVLIRDLSASRRVESEGTGEVDFTRS